MAIKKIGGCGESFGLVDRRHGRMEESTHYIVDGMQVVIGLAILAEV